MLTIRLLPARQGDALWIEWGKPSAPHRMLIDMGTEEVGKKLNARIRALPVDQREFDLLVVTHIDGDHIGGVLTGLADEDAEPIPGLRIWDVWFNGFPHLSGRRVVSAGLESMGGAQGERLSSWLRKQAWNKAFAGGPVVRTPGTPAPTVTLHDELSLTILGPTPDRCADLIPVWKEEVEEALKKGTLTEVSEGLERLGPKVPPILEDVGDLRALADAATRPDPRESNGASIVLLLRYHDRTVLLTGDAFATEVVAGIEAVSPSAPLRLDAFKLPHHCSQNNVSSALVEAVDCDRWLISTDGTRFRHPDPTAIARILVNGSPRPRHLEFNVRSTFSGWWDNEVWRDMFDYTTSYGSQDDGLTIALD